MTTAGGPQGLIFDIQRFSPHDGPGIRTTVFLKGCPLDCLWCHNPEGISAEPQILYFGNRCITCDQCVEACPQGRPVTDAGDEETLARCSVCGACVEACPTKARELAGRHLSVSELLEIVLRDRIFYDDSGGGVTFSGGEPLGQLPFLLEALAACRAEEIRTAVDTSGAASLDGLLAAARLTDLFLYDVKVVDDATHRRVTGVSNRRILSNLRKLADHHDNIWLRVPVVPGINDDPRNLEATAELAAVLPSVRKVCLLPYHRIGEEKLRRLGRGPGTEEFVEPAPGHVRRLARLVEAAGVEAQIGG